MTLTTEKRSDIPRARKIIQEIMDGHHGHIDPEVDGMLREEVLPRMHKVKGKRKVTDPSNSHEETPI